MTMSQDALSEFYLICILVYASILMIFQLLIWFFNRSEEIKDKVSLIKNYDHTIFLKLSFLRKIYMISFLLAKAAMWSKAPYTFMLFITWHKFPIYEIAQLYIVDAVFSLLSGPFLGYFADTFGRKLVSFFYPFNTIIILLLRMTGNKPMAYCAQIFSGLSSGILATSFEAWVNYEVSKILNQSLNCNELLPTGPLNFA
jgi:hypothetical protein